MPLLRAVAAAALLLLAQRAAGVELTLEREAALGYRSHWVCLTEEMDAGGVAVINWEAENGAAAAQVYWPNATLMLEAPAAAKDHVGFSAKEAGDYKVCFQADPPAPPAAAQPPAADAAADPAAVGAEGAEATPSPPPPSPPPPFVLEGEQPPVRVAVEWITGVGARDWKSVAKKDHLRAVASQLEELETELREVYKEMLAARAREEEMRDVSERVNAKVAWLSVLSLATSCTLAVWQLAHMKAYFIKKKLL